MRVLLLIAVLAIPQLARAEDAASQPEAAPVVRGEREIVRSNGRLVAVIPDGGNTQLNLPPGDYVVRFHGQSGEVVRVSAGAVVELSVYNLTLVGSGGHFRPRRYVEASPDAPYAAPTPSYEVDMPPRRAERAVSDRYVLRVAIGWTDGLSSFNFPGIALGNNAFSANLALDFGITERLRWIAPLPLFAYRIGDRERGKVELEPWLGVTNVGFAWNDYDGTTFAYALGAGIDGRIWATRNQAWAFGIHTQAYGAFNLYHEHDRGAPDTIRPVLSSAYQLKSRIVSLSIGVGVAENVLFDGVRPHWDRHDSRFDLRVGIGSMQNFGPFPEPLVAFALSKRFSLDFYGSIEWSLDDGHAADSALVGFTWKL